jgi:tRNA nucleotidyltransferase (CCA-adding enzyme)
MEAIVRTPETHPLAPAAALLARLPAAAAGRVAAAAALARRMGVALYLVGGTVRDLVLGRESPDLDLVVEGDGLGFATRLAEEVGGSLRLHREFLTAVVFDPEGLVIDLATARSEVYRAPAALPEVRPGTLATDLFRRDFTVNTLAIDLVREQPALLDLHGGARDLERGVLRVLHARSFVDDPTRVLRGVRLERRFGLRLDAEAERLAVEAVAGGAFARLSGGRLRDELVRLLDEPAVGLPGIERLAGLGLLAVLHPRLALDERARRRIAEALEALAQVALAAMGELPSSGAPGAPGPGKPGALGPGDLGALAGWAPFAAGKAPGMPPRRWRLLLMALIEDLSAEEREAVADRLLLAGDEHRLIASFPERLDAARRELGRDAAPHRVAEALRGLAGEELLLLAAEGAETASWVRRFLGELVRCELTVRGADLLAAGASAGPAIGQALRATWRARVDGEITASGERAFALDWLRRNAARRNGEPE